MFPKLKITHIKPTLRLSQRIAEEAQLLAEEKWIIDALKKIKAQRNGLQIERLQLESMRAKILASMNKDQSENSSAGQVLTAEAPGVSKASTLPMAPSDPLDGLRLSNVDILNDDELCNTEELNLSVTNSVFNQGSFNQICDEEEDEEDMDNCVLDIDLLMSGK